MKTGWAPTAYDNPKLAFCLFEGAKVRKTWTLPLQSDEKLAEWKKNPKSED
jgi:hypothetical protein